MNKTKNVLLGTSLSVALALSGGSAFAAGLAGMLDPTPIAESGMYVSVFAGGTLPTTINGHYSSYDFGLPVSAGYIGGAAVGRQLMTNLRGELELSFSSHSVPVGGDIDIWDTIYTGSSGAAGNVSAIYLLANVWHDFDATSSFTPYIGGGLGGALVIPQVSAYYNEYRWNGASIAPAAQFGAGVTMPLGDNVSLDLGYRAKVVFNATLGVDDTSSASEDVTNAWWLDQVIQAGLTVNID